MSFGTAGLQVVDAQQVVHTLTGCFYMAVHHRRRGRQVEAVGFVHHLDPLLDRRFGGRDGFPHAGIEDLGPGTRQGVQSGGDQPLVRESYQNPVYTYATNVMGTVNFLEAVRHCPSVKSVVNVTTDKVYLNNEWEYGYREIDALDGYDPYSNSKSCSELVTSSYKKSFFADRDIAISTCRAGNVIGGGDFAKDRIIPDCVRAMGNKGKIVVRNPYSTRPYQHVLEPVCTYLMLAMKQYENKALAGCYNVGPDDCDCVNTGSLVDLFCKYWGSEAEWINVSEANAPHEANFLKLDCSKIKKILGWQPVWHIDDAVVKSVEWSKAYLQKQDVNAVMEKQINEFMDKFENR